ncbi:leucine--tRNA ligase [[Eubacterium] cellulosolvens]
MNRPNKLDWAQLEKKWLSLWEQQHIFEANPLEGKKKFFLTVAYPYPNSPQHIGHGRTYTLTDVYARYLRMSGYNVLFPMAFHYTGTPVLAMAKRLQENDPELIKTFIDIYHVPQEKIPEFYTPVNIARYFHNEIKDGMRALGYSIDWRREFTTIDPPYSRFIEWQFESLREKGLITKGSHPVGWCPKCGNPVGQHDTLGDVEPQIEEFILLKFPFDDAAMPTATLRPETVFGVTNIWVNPDAIYVKADIDGEKWVVSKKAAEKLRLLNRNVKIEEEFSGDSLLGKKAQNPASGASILILPASFVDPSHATGVVMSVPAHAPYDYQALEDLKGNSGELAKHRLDPGEIQAIVPIPLIKVEGYSEIPAKDAIQKRGITSQNDKKLEDATEEIYSKEFHTGVMTQITGKYMKMPVAEAKLQLIDDYLQERKADRMYEILNRPVICRCGTECVVKVFENQWFINYGDKEWKNLVLNCLDTMTIRPEDIKPEFIYTVGWLKEKACARREGLGTKIPWDQSWTIESLSDSVIYMAYYAVSRLIKEHQIHENQLTKEVFDYILLDKGDPEKIAEASGINSEILHRMNNEFQYFYPLDSRHSGRDLVPNHLTFFIFNHVALFPQEMWPQQIVVNGSVLMEGKKMSKSFGNIIPIRDGVKEFSADSLRLTILATSGLLQDADFSPTLARSIKERLERFYYQVCDLAEKPPDPKQSKQGLSERWILSRLQTTIKDTTDALEMLQAREAIQHAFYTLEQDIQFYIKIATASLNTKKKGISQQILRAVFKTRLQLLAPFAPFLCEELWSKFGETGFISTSPWPQPDPALIDPEAEASITYLKTLLADTSSILKATGITPTTIRYYISSKWKNRLYKQALSQAQDQKLKLDQLIKSAMQDPKIRAKGKEAAKYIQNLYSSISKMPADLIKQHHSTYVDEVKTIQDNLPMIKSEFHASIDVYAEDDEEKVDPKKRANLAMPLRPAIYIE